MKKNWKRIIATAAVTIGTAAGAMGVVPGTAGIAAAAGECTARTTFQAFKPWGDANQYFLLPGGSFETGTMSGWMLGSSSVVNDQAPWKVNGSTHSKALNVPAYTTVMPPNFCLNSNEEWMRLFYKDPGVAGAQLLVKIEAWSSAGRVVQEYKINAGSAGWKVSPQIPMPNKRDGNGEQWVTLTITPVSTAATWRIDDVMIDPWKSR